MTEFLKELQHLTPAALIVVTLYLVWRIIDQVRFRTKMKNSSINYNGDLRENVKAIANVVASVEKKQMNLEKCIAVLQKNGEAHLELGNKQLLEIARLTERIGGVLEILRAQAGSMIPPSPPSVPR